MVVCQPIDLFVGKAQIYIVTYSSLGVQIENEIQSHGKYSWSSSCWFKNHSINIHAVYEIHHQNGMPFSCSSYYLWYRKFVFFEYSQYIVNESCSCTCIQKSFQNGFFYTNICQGFSWFWWKNSQFCWFSFSSLDPKILRFDGLREQLMNRVIVVTLVDCRVREHLI